MSIGILVILSLKSPHIAEAEDEAKGSQPESDGVLSSLASRTCLGQDDGPMPTEARDTVGSRKPKWRYVDTLLPDTELLEHLKSAALGHAWGSGFCYDEVLTRESYQFGWAHCGSNKITGTPRLAV